MLNCMKSFIVNSRTLVSPVLHGPDVLYQQTRNTFILKRKHPPGLHKKGYQPRTLKHRHYIYELIEDTNIRPQKPIDVILTKYVEGVGNVGERLTMKPNQAYVTLLLPGLAVYASPKNIEKYKDTGVLKSEEATYSSPYAQKTIQRLSTFLLSVVMSQDVPWTLETWHMHASFRKAGVYVPEDAITMPERAISGPNLEIENKEFYVTVTINNTEKVNVRCRIHHHTNNAIQKLPPDPLFFERRSTAIFPEDQPILDSLPLHRKCTKSEDTTDDGHGSM